MRLIGNTDAKIDAKGRVFLPAVFRRLLNGADEGQIILRKDIFQDCLVLYPEDVWNEYIDTLRGRLNRWNKAHQQIYRQFVAEAETVTLDANGRFLLSKRLMSAAGLNKEVKFIGMGDTIEIWDAEKAGKPFMDPDDFSASLESIMNDTTPDQERQGN